MISIIIIKKFNLIDFFPTAVDSNKKNVSFENRRHYYYILNLMFIQFFSKSSEYSLIKIGQAKLFDCFKDV
jgi:hypothetical protein